MTKKMYIVCKLIYTMDGRKYTNHKIAFHFTEIYETMNRLFMNSARKICTETADHKIKMYCNNTILLCIEVKYAGTLFSWAHCNWDLMSICFCFFFFSYEGFEESLSFCCHLIFNIHLLWLSVSSQLSPILFSLH